MGSISRMQKPYEAAMKKNWDSMIKWYKEAENRIHLLSPLTYRKETAFHMAVCSGRKKPFKDLLEIAEEGALLEFVYTIKTAYGNTPLHEAAAYGNIKVVKLLVQKGGTKLLQIRNDYRGETPLYRAAAYGKRHIVEYLASQPGQMTSDKKLNDIHRERKKKRGDTPPGSILHDAIRGEHFGTALLLLKLDESLVQSRRDSGKSTLELLASIPSAFKSRYPMNMWTTLLYFCAPLVDDGDEDDDYSRVDDDDHIEQGDTKVRADLKGGQSKKEINCKLACLNMFKDIRTMCHLIWRAFFQVAETMYLLIWRAFFQECPKMKEVQKAKRKHRSALRLAQKLVKKDTWWLKCETEDSPAFFSAMEGEDGTLQVLEQKEDYEQIPITDIEIMEDEDQNLDVSNIDKGKEKVHEGPSQDKDHEEQKEDYEQNPLFTAIKYGIIEIVEEILDAHPQAASTVSPMRHNILHVVIRHRQKEIFHLVKKMKITMNWLVRDTDKFGYTILHHAADMAGITGVTRPGPAYQLQDELKWFRRVKKVMPSHYAMVHDKKRRIALDFFKESHEKQLKEAQEWIKGISQACSTVAILVATLAFAAAYALPGGSNEHGRPILLDSALFLVFTVMIVISLWSSLTSLVIFLSILTSPFELEDFEFSLPRKLTFGFFLLFFSVATTMVAFTATIFLTFNSAAGLWSKTFSYSAALVPICIFSLMQFPLYVAVADTLKYISKSSRSLRHLLRKIKIKRD